MKTVVTVASLVLCAASADAQITAMVNQLPDGAGEIRIRNDSAVALMAYAVAVNVAVGERETPVRLYVDAVADPDTTPLLPNEDKPVLPERIRVPHEARVPRGWREIFKPPIVTAGILADGTTTGDPALATRLLLRRSSALLPVETALYVLSDAGNRNVDCARLVGQSLLRQRRAALVESRPSLADETFIPR